MLSANPEWLPEGASKYRGGKVILTVHMLGQGGTDRVCAHLARGFAAAGFRTEVVVFCSGGAAGAALLPIFGDDVRIRYLGSRVGGRAIDLLRYLPAFVRHLRAAKPDAVISTGNNMNWITTVGHRLAGHDQCALVLKTTNPVIRPADRVFARTVRSLGYAMAFKAADRVLTLSDAETAQLKSAFPLAADRFRTTINPYVTPEMLAQRPLPPKVQGEKLIIAVGRLEPQKQLDLLLHAFSETMTAGTRLVLLGEGRCRPMLEHLVRTLGLVDRVQLPGFIPDVAPWFARADLCVLPSAYEGLPAVVLEAMAANCPVISTDCFPAARELVGSAEGCEVVRADEIALADAIDRSLAGRRPTQLHEIARKYSIDNAIHSHVEEVAAVIQSLLRHQRAVLGGPRLKEAV